MRTFFIALLIAMLPLRGWVGGAMATEMASSQVQVQVMASMPADCADMDMAQKDKARCGSCATCQVCHVVVLATPMPAVPAIFIPVSLPRSAVIQYASAALALGQKPPIS